ncbi:MAG: protein translocase SEC61 complex subunit gamma [Candidatus Freyarchaeota archaeon]|nr:protein translocase SEC61 complex subunit gamma [Candidatus Jordarchaeia archaeon]MBS7270103.1 protein translocase SEC61 complex subunit gamma [Candidatus Jordarchaeia archaeon]MBS7280817.1 protein translocase SEC61 complex subunit gamma [Candidatus Jordarchaeia archaeon]
MGIIGFIRRSRRLFKLARYPTRKEMWAIIRVCVLGIIIIGALAFIITMLFVNAFLPIIRPSTIIYI